MNREILALNELDEYGNYWYLCCICGEHLYSEWTVAGARVEANNEYVAFCAHHNKEEIENLQEWAKTISFQLNDWSKGVNVDREYDYIWIRDVGHGWLRVRKDEYLLTGFKATRYSFQDDRYVYLEEDVDAPTYLELHQPNPKNIVEEFYNGQSPVRLMDRIQEVSEK